MENKQTKTEKRVNKAVQNVPDNRISVSEAGQRLQKLVINANNTTGT
jgi:hypothetical protein